MLEGYMLSSEYQCGVEVKADPFVLSECRQR